MSAHRPAERAILNALAAAPHGLTWWGLRRACGDDSQMLTDLQARGVVVCVGEDSAGWAVYGLAAPIPPAEARTPASAPEITTAGRVSAGGRE